MLSYTGDLILPRAPEEVEGGLVENGTMYSRAPIERIPPEQRSLGARDGDGDGLILSAGTQDFLFQFIKEDTTNDGSYIWIRVVDHALGTNYVAAMSLAGFLEAMEYRTSRDYAAVSLENDCAE